MGVVLDKNNNEITVFSTKNEKHIGMLYDLLKESFDPSELESKEAMIEKTQGEQKDNTEFLTYVAFKDGKLVGGYTCLVIKDEKLGNISYIEYIVTHPDERRNHVATAILQGGVMSEYKSDAMVDIVDPNKAECETKEEFDNIASKSKFWNSQRARKLDVKNFQQPDFENEENIDEGSYLAYIPNNPSSTEIPSEKLSNALYKINVVSNGVENPREKFPKMFEEIDSQETISISQLPLTMEVLPDEDLAQ